MVKRQDPVWNAVYGKFNPARRNQSVHRQDVLESMYRRVLGELAMARFEWKGLEDTAVKPRFLELTLYRNALAVFFQDTNKADPETGELLQVGTDQFFVAQASASGSRNFIDDPTEFTLYGSNWEGRRLSTLFCVPIWANAFRVPDWDIVDVYAWKLAQIDCTIEINVNSARRPKVMAYNENSKLTMMNVNDMIDRGESVIPINFNLGEILQSVDLGVHPDTIERLHIVRTRLWNECMGLLGINNANQDKKERLVEAEVGANDDQIGSARRVNLNARQEAARAINKKFGLNISVDYYQDAPSEIVPPSMENLG